MAITKVPKRPSRRCLNDSPDEKGSSRAREDRVCGPEEDTLAHEKCKLTYRGGYSPQNEEHPH